jgi:hypothetical protein
MYISASLSSISVTSKLWNCFDTTATDTVDSPQYFLTIYLSKIYFNVILLPSHPSNYNRFPNRHFFSSLNNMSVPLIPDISLLITQRWISLQTGKRGSDCDSLQLRYEARIAGQYSNTLHAWGSRVQKPVWAKFSVLVETGPEAHPVSCTMVPGFFPETNWPGHGIDHLPFSNTKNVYG